METIHIALSFDDDYTEHSIVLMTSILANKTDEKIHFHILDGGLSNLNKNKVFELKNCEITFHLINKKMAVNNLFILSLADIISVDKLIYLDTDTIVNSSLKDIGELGLDDNYIAAVEDANGKKYAKRFRLVKGKKFFNSGVMVINCPKWRENNISARAVEIALQNTGAMLGDNQIILNQLFDGHVKFLDLKWNLQCCPINILTVYAQSEDYKSASENPAIINYAGDFKPWKKGLGCFNPKQKEYFKYHKMTSYAFKNYELWRILDKLMALRGIGSFIKSYPLFFTKKLFWKNLVTNFYS